MSDLSQKSDDNPWVWFWIVTGSFVGLLAIIAGLVIWLLQYL